MRELKFRVYSAKLDCMCFFDLHNIDYSLLIHHGITLSECNAQQFTGLTDKGGLDIYEGDLLIVCNTRICEVIFHEKAGCWDLKLKEVAGDLPVGGVCPASYQYKTEIIGNVCQGPQSREIANG